MLHVVVLCRLVLAFVLRLDQSLSASCNALIFGVGSLTLRSLPPLRGRTTPLLQEFLRYSSMSLKGACLARRKLVSSVVVGAFLFLLVLPFVYPQGVGCLGVLLGILTALPCAGGCPSCHGPPLSLFSSLLVQPISEHGDDVGHAIGPLCL